MEEKIEEFSEKNGLSWMERLCNIVAADTALTT